MPKIAKLGKNARQILETKRDELFKEIKKYLNIDDSKTYIIGRVNFLILFETVHNYIKELEEFKSKVKEELKNEKSKL